VIDGLKLTGLLAGLLVFFDRLVVVFALEEHVSGVLDLCCHGQDLFKVLLDEMLFKKTFFFSHSLMTRPNKLERLSLAGLSSRVYSSGAPFSYYPPR
jgi:hypothetical protein